MLSRALSSTSGADSIASAMCSAQAKSTVEPLVIRTSTSAAQSVLKHSKRGMSRMLRPRYDRSRMSDQVIAVYSASAVENTLPRTITETSGDDISTDPVYVSLGSWTTPGAWLTPDSVTRGTISVADYRARTGQQPQSADGTPLADGVLLHWVAVALEIGNAFKPLAGNYWLYVTVTDSPERLVRRTSGRITIT